MTPTPEQIDAIVGRFLAWKLPDNFNPDGGITATRPNYAPEVKWELRGTNLLDYQQAKEMVLHILEGLNFRAHLHEPAQTAAVKLEEVEARFARVKADPSPENIAKLGRSIRRLHRFGASVFTEVLGFTIAETNEQGDTGVVAFSGGGPKDDPEEE